MRFLRRYLLLAGLLFNVLVCVYVGLELTASVPIAPRAWVQVMSVVHEDHPRLASGIARIEAVVRAVFRGGSHEAPPRSGSRPAVPDRRFQIVPVLMSSPSRPAGRVLQVGPDRSLQKPSAAARVAEHGDTIEISPGDYAGDVAVWTQDRLTIRGADGMVWLDATATALPEDKAIWVMKGDDAVIENIAFSNARSTDLNGAGLRQEGAGLTVRNCYFFANETGILAGANPRSDILVEHSEFAWNGTAHNLYIGGVRSLTFRFNYVHHGFHGSDLKSRAHLNQILYNRVTDEADGLGNYVIDLSNGGVALVIGNLLHQSRYSENDYLLAFAPEEPYVGRQALYAVNNTFVSERPAAVFIRNNHHQPVYVYNNLFVGPGEMLSGSGILVANLQARPPSWRDRLASLYGFLGGDPGDRPVAAPGLADAGRHDYRLVTGSPAIDRGATLDDADGMSMHPAWEYVHPRGGRRRPADDALDVGAYEYVGRRTFSPPAPLTHPSARARAGR